MRASAGLLHAGATSDRAHRPVAAGRNQRPDLARPLPGLRRRAEWLYVLFILRFQSSLDCFMALRMHGLALRLKDNLCQRAKVSGRAGATAGRRSWRWWSTTRRSLGGQRRSGRIWLGRKRGLPVPHKGTPSDRDESPERRGPAGTHSPTSGCGTLESGRDQCRSTSLVLDGLQDFGVWDLDELSLGPFRHALGLS